MISVSVLYCTRYESQSNNFWTPRVLHERSTVYFIFDLISFIEIVMDTLNSIIICSALKNVYAQIGNGYTVYCTSNFR